MTIHQIFAAAFDVRASGDMIVDNVLARSADSACALISEQTGLDQSELYATVIPD